MRAVLTSNLIKYQSSNPFQRYFITNFLRSITRIVETIQVHSVLDAGCGEGFVLSKFQHFNIGNVHIGIDTNKTAVALGHRLFPTLHIRQGSVYNTLFHDDSFDIVVCTEVLEHVRYPHKALNELVRVSGKYVLVSVPHEPWFCLANFLRGKYLFRFGNNPEHKHHWSKNSFIRLLQSHKLKILHIVLPFPWILVLAKKESVMAEDGANSI